MFPSPGVCAEVKSSLSPAICIDMFRTDLAVPQGCFHWCQTVGESPPPPRVAVESSLRTRPDHCPYDE